MTSRCFCWDDVLSELDSSRQKYLLQSIRNIQTFITCTGVGGICAESFSAEPYFFRWQAEQFP